MNKVLVEKIEHGSDFARCGFMPVQKKLTEPSLQQISEKIHGAFFCNARFARNYAANVGIGAVSSAIIRSKLSTGTLLVVPGDREDIVLTAPCWICLRTHRCLLFSRRRTAIPSRNAIFP